MNKYFHGGPAGFQRHSFLLPPTITKAQCTTELVGSNPVHRRDRVYITTDINAALLFACVFKRAAIYEVEPVGNLEIDPDCDANGLSFECEKARILRVHKLSERMLRQARHAVSSTLLEARKQ